MSLLTEWNARKVRGRAKLYGVILPATVILIYLDDAGYGDFGFSGHPVIRTPKIDQLAKEGVWVRDYSSVSSACTASRYALLTGRYPVRSGFQWVLNPDSPRFLHPRETTMAEVLKEKGFATKIVGKWHLGNGREMMTSPLGHGFDSYFGFPYSNDMIPPRYPDLPLLRDLTVATQNPDQTKITEQFTSESLNWLKDQKGSAFLYLAHSMPHTPLHPGLPFAGQSARGPYGDVIEELDASIGRIMDFARRQKNRRTLVLLASDNGPWILQGLNGGSSGPFRDGKGSGWEGGVRVPLVAWGDGIDGLRRQSGPMASVDLMPFVSGWAGSYVLGVDGVFPRPADRAFGLFGPGNQLFAVRKGRWKLHLRVTSQVGKTYFTDPLPYLFDVQADPSETVNLASSRPEVVKEIQAEAEKLPKIGDGSYWSRLAS